MKIVILDEYKAQAADLQPWFKETREKIYGPLQEVRNSCAMLCLDRDAILLHANNSA